MIYYYYLISIHILTPLVYNKLYIVNKDIELSSLRYIKLCEFCTLEQYNLRAVLHYAYSLRILIIDLSLGSDQTKPI